MKPKQLLILVAVLAVLGLVAFIAGRTGGGDKPSTAELRGQDILEGWDINAVSGIEVKDAKGTVTLTKPESNIWLVKERKDFPADRAKVENMVRRIWSTPVMQAFEAGASQDERMELLAPDSKGDDDEKKATKLTFKGKDGSDIGHLLIGKSKTPTAGPGAAPGSGGKDTRYLRTTKDATLVLEVPNGFNADLSGTGWPYAFGSIEADPGLWLNKEDFIKVQKIATIALNTKEEGKESYSLSRESDTGDFTLAGDIPVGKELDASKVSGLKTLLSNASFEDLLTEEEVGKIDEAKLTDATLTTFEGFTYKILIGEKDSEKNRIPVKFTVTGELATERVVDAGKEETEEEKTKAEADFQTKLKENQAKLAQEKALESHWFTLSSFRIDPVLKSRPDLIKDEEPAEGEVPSALAKPPGAPGAVPQLPPGLKLPPGLNLPQGLNVPPPAKKPVIEAVSEPIAVPPLTKGATATTPPIEIPRPPKPPVVEEVKEGVEAVKEAPKAATEAVKDEAKAAVESATEAANAALENAAKAATDKAAGDQ